MFNMNFIFNSLILCLVLIKCWFLIAACYNLYFSFDLKCQESKKKSVFLKSTEQNVNVSKPAQQKPV
ncbi:unnamed protein product [Oikopleura dioica]|uniref:Uncharacterized protein n=1 Tax=Oikopleura dioica TaxID=34765 RepID=E4X7Y9_OIKDI|nr:unnamed protein product [Oikopleura dioica]